MGGDREIAHVVVDGWGPLAEELTAQLRRCGVPVRGGGHAADSAEVALSGAGVPGGPTGADAEPPGAVVVVAEGRAPGWAGAPWQARGIPHLPVVLGGRRVVVGPLVLPGRTACLRCARPAWDTGTATVSEAASDTPTGSLVLAAAVATVTVLAVLRGDHSLGGISTEIGLAELSVTHRLWNLRPDCRCARVRMAV
ncbi:MAG TPA: hypothetical protein VFI44_12745 [Ornithinibacter sp.]|nr:hypothetical protein [Ornithinibacter sp.]